MYVGIAKIVVIVVGVMYIFGQQPQQERQRKFVVHWTNDMSARYATPRTPTNCGAELTAFAACADERQCMYVC